MEDAAEMMETAAACKKQLAVIFQNRYIPGVQEVKRLIAQGAFGQIKGAWSHLAWYRPESYYKCDWKGSWEKEGGGVVIDQAIHSIDLVRYMMGSEAKTIQGHIARRILTTIEVEDEADAAITFENGATYAFSACNYYVTNSPIRIEICGENGRALLTETEMEITLAGHKPYKVPPPPRGPEHGGRSILGRISQRAGPGFLRKPGKGAADQRPPAGRGKTLELVLGIYRSAKENRTVKL